MGMAERIAGQWIADEDMHPMTNIAGRRWWAAGNLSAFYNGYWATPGGMKPVGLYWHFPSGTITRQEPSDG